MTLICLGLSCRTAPLDLRERLAYTPAALHVALSRRAAKEVVILSTCNRLEVYAVGGAEELKSLISLIEGTQKIPRDSFVPYLYRYAGAEAALHLCRVATGLDSMILGEPQILGQVTEAYETALDAGAAGPVLTALFRAAIRAGKRARTETAIARNPASISSVAVRLAEKTVGNLAGRRVLVVGAGEMATLAVEALRARGVQQIKVVNRTPRRAAVLAEQGGGEALRFDQLAEAIHWSDVVITCTGAPNTHIDQPMVRRAVADRTQPLVVIDIAVPRDVDPAVGQLPRVHLFDIDCLRNHLDSALAERRNEIPHVETIVAEEVSAFETWLRGADIMPVVADLRAKAERIRQRELERALRSLPDLDPKTRQHIERLSKSLVNKLLHDPTLRLKAEASNGRADEYAAAVRYLFALND